MKYITVNIATWGFISPCYKQKADTVDDRLNVWKCKINANGKIVSSKLIQSNLYTIDQIDEKGMQSLFLNVHDAKQYAVNKIIRTILERK